MDEGLLDSSALLAVIFGEPGSEMVAPILSGSAISAVNAAEVQAKIVREGADSETAWELTSGAVGRIIAFDAVQAKLCGSLIVHTRSASLSAGDRACLAASITMGLPIYTADRAWLKIDVGCDIRMIR